MADGRPDPAELIRRIQREESRNGTAGAPRGRLKVYFGMSPGVGKTYAMLAAAQRMAATGVDVAVGVAETHGRAETEQMLLGLDVLPRRSVVYRGPDGSAAPVTLHEFDLDAAIARKPDILLVDELAHTNAPGCKNEKRWQDVRECLNAGINVCTTLNVQHIESLNDVISQITNVTVRETVPDWIVDEADEIELVDTPVEVLHERLKAGKVYLGESAARAVDPTDGFFRKGNLTALRELALRRTAAWVDSEMRRYKQATGIRTVWPAGERILVAVSPSPMSPKLVRAAKRMAASMHAELLAVYVETPRTARISPRDRERLLQTMRVAESLGASTTTLTADNAARELIAFARSRNVSRIVVGKTSRSRWHEAILGNFVNNLIRESGEIDISVIRGDAEEREDAAPSEPRSSRQPRGMSGLSWRCAAATGIVAAASALAFLFYNPPDLSEEALILLAGVVIVGLRLGRGPVAWASFLSVLALNFFFTEPRFTLYIDNTGYFVTLGVMLSIGLIVGTLAARTQEQARAAALRERRTAAFYAMSRELAAAQDARDVATGGTRHLHDMLACDAIVAVPGHARTTLDPLAAAGTPDWFTERERGVAQWAFENAKTAGLGTQKLPSAAARYVPLMGAGTKMGVLAIRPRNTTPLGTPDLLALDTCASQIASALERVALGESQQAARLEAERERLRSALLSSVSHDLRTPLAAITGAASALEEGDSVLDSATRASLLRSIMQQSGRLSDLIANLVFATRLEAGAVTLNREWTTVEEIVGVGLERHRAELAARPFRVHFPTDLPMIRVDNAMLPQVVHNLVENALRYTPTGTPISLSVWATDSSVVVKVSDEGPGLAEDEASKVFERFYRGRISSSESPAQAQRLGMGLGLTICEGIIKAHGGRIWAEPNIPRGVAFLFSLPLDQPQPALPDELVDATRAAPKVVS